MLLLPAVADCLEQGLSEVLARWRTHVSADPQISASKGLSRSQLNDHIPVLLTSFAKRLRGGDSRAQKDEERELSEAHGRHRWQQGYDLRGMLREWGHLNATLVNWLGENGASGQAHLSWAEFVAFNEAEAVALYEKLLQSEARAKLRDMEQALGQLQEWERARGVLLREASHDLRGGLSVVLSASSLIGHPNVSVEQRDQVAVLLASGVKNLTDILSDLLEMARLEAGVETRETSDLDVGELLSELCVSWQALAQEKGLHFETSGPKSLRVEGDAPKMRRIAQNLALNAIKYTQDGRVSVAWGEAEIDRWFIEISDTGEGLETASAAPLAKNLESAAPGAPLPTSSPPASNRPAGGEGIGLAIVRRLCELLDASIELNSTEAGSSFCVTFPRAY